LIIIIVSGIIKKKNIMDVEIKNLEKLMIVYLKGRMDLVKSNDLERSLFKLINEEKGKHLLLNFEDVDYLHSSGVRMLISLHIRLEEHGAMLMLCCINQAVKKILEFVDIMDMIKIFNSEEEAITAFPASDAGGYHG
jgi:anti-anti-sigma factor